MLPLQRKKEEHKQPKKYLPVEIFHPIYKKPSGILVHIPVNTFLENYLYV
jgi:hypothetical protein